jgi:hypothetical protein
VAGEGSFDREMTLPRLLLFATIATLGCFGQHLKLGLKTGVHVTETFETGFLQAGGTILASGSEAQQADEVKAALGNVVEPRHNGSWEAGNCWRLIRSAACSVSAEPE